jgi:hypothetical protein
MLPTRLRRSGFRHENVRDSAKTGPRREPQPDRLWSPNLNDLGSYSTDQSQPASIRNEIPSADRRQDMNGNRFGTKFDRHIPGHREVRIDP